MESDVFITLKLKNKDLLCGFVDSGFVLLIFFLLAFDSVNAFPNAMGREI